MISSEYPPKWGGVGVVAYYLSTWMAKRGHEVHVVTRKQSIGYQSSHDNIHIHPVKWLRAPMLFTTSFGRNAVRWIRESGLEFDIVHVQSNMALLPERCYDELDVPVVSTMHGTWRGERSTISLRNLSPSIAAVNDLAIMYLGPFFDRFEDHAIERSNGVITISYSDCRALKERGVKNRYDRRIHLPDGIDVEEFHPRNMDPELKGRYGIPAGNKMIASVGRFAARKGIREVLEAFRLMYSERKDLTLFLVGWGPLESEIRSKLRKYSMEDAVRLVISPPHKEMQAIVATADLAMFHSYWEGYGLTFGEALASGTPCVLTDIGGAPEMVVEGTGKLVRVGDVKGQAKAALELLAREDLPEWGSRGREHIVRYCSWEDIAARTEEFYEWVVEDPENKEGWRDDFERCP
ncbi:MAG: glycosyltransferase family 4 protein [Candidatus Thermoplasmatota archaeon]|nr:glycosyltransferase family 4 protein [Candidatus Thermoplasmatota archaeon]